MGFRDNWWRYSLVAGMVVLNPNKSLVLNKNRVHETTRSDGEAMRAQWVLGTIGAVYEDLAREATRRDGEGKGFGGTTSTI